MHLIQTGHRSMFLEHQSLRHDTMNNSQFRKLVLDTPARKPATGDSDASSSSGPRRNGATPSALGSRMRSSIPMTPYVSYVSYLSDEVTGIDS